jgi:undecaprenyl-phosphate 4-deoxy-4-formamido-L-arabinose transferase
VVEELISVIEKRGNLDYEIILVNDCSPDNVYKVISELSSQFGQIKGLELSRNFGQSSALMAGYHFVSGDIVLSMDDDGQTPPSEIFTLIDNLDDNTDVVYAKYIDTPGKSFFRKLGSYVNNIMAEYLIGKPKNIEMTSFVACKKFVIDEIICYKHAFPYVGGLIFRVTNRAINIPIKQKKRISGESGYTLRKLISLWLNGFTAFSVKPLRLGTYMGLLTAFIGFVFGTVIIIRKLLIPDMQAGYASLMAVFLFLGGMLLFMLGLLGEYIGRIYISINNAPQFVIRSTINLDIKEE